MNRFDAYFLIDESKPKRKIESDSDSDEDVFNFGSSLADRVLGKEKPKKPAAKKEKAPKKEPAAKKAPAPKKPKPKAAATKRKNNFSGSDSSDDFDSGKVSTK